MNRTDKVKRNRLLAIWIIVVPMVVACVYYAVFSVDRYSSTAQVVVRQAGVNNAAQQAPGLALLLGGMNPASREETLYLRQYIDSLGMLRLLDDKLGWRGHYAKQMSDPLYWLSDSGSLEDLIKYYRRVVTVHYDELTGLLTVEVQALSPEFADQVMRLILSQSEEFVNEISHRMARDQVDFAEEELFRARRAYEKSRDELIAFQSENNILDAEATAESRAQIVAGIEAQLATERAKLQGLMSSLSADSPQVRQQRIKIDALNKQVQKEKQTLVSSADKEHLNVIAARYRNLMVDNGIAEEMYKLSVAALENARIEANKKIRTLVTVVNPPVADEAIYPRVWYNLFTLLVVLVLIYGIIRFIIASVEDHRD